MNHLFAVVKARRDDDSFPGSFEAVASMATVDRDGEIVAKGAFNPLPVQVPIHVDHRMDSEGLVGSGRPYYTPDGVLKVAGTFAGTPRAQIIRQLVSEGHLSSMSVGFFAATKKDVDGVPTISKAELIEVSFVTVPSNREARVLASRDFRSTNGREMSGRACTAAAHAQVLLAELALADLDAVMSPQRQARKALEEANRTLRMLDGR